MVVVIDKVRKEDCCGCRACVNKCPKDAIKMVLGNDGFYYPQITDRCINCNLCEMVCPSLHSYGNTDKKEIHVYAAQSLNKKILEASSSGGLFYELAKEILSKSGAVFGAAFDSQHKLSHVCCESIEELSPLLGSKYLQSNIGITYRMAQSLLDSGRIVLFVGTPCQIRGLQNYVSRNKELLYTVDVICHGVPSQKNFDEYIDWVENSENSRVIDIFFRDKSTSWKQFAVRKTMEKSTVCTPIYEDLYMRSFLNNLNLRESCYHCPANDYRSGSDITIGDFWNIEKITSTFEIEQGVSALLVHTEKGRQLLDNVKKNVLIEEQELDFLVQNNHVLEYSCERPVERNEYLKTITNYNFEKLDDRYVCKSLKEMVRKRIKRCLKRKS